MGFLQAVFDWKQQKETYVKQKLKETKRVADRVEILLTIPKENEKEFKDLAKLRRKEFDEKNKPELAKTERDLSFEFERLNPPPNRSDYTD